MRLLHIADLHIGKRVNGFNLLDDQQYILEQILNIAKTEDLQGVLLAGDIYDKSQPGVEAVRLLDDFLTALLDVVPDVFMISGNHDSPERLEFGSRLLKSKGLHIAGAYHGHIDCVTLEDAFGLMHVYLLPFVKPITVKAHLSEMIETCEDGVRAALSRISVNRKDRNLLLAHQFVTANGQMPNRSDSEMISVGGLDNVDISVFNDFDYVALGHIHGPQRIGRDTARYGGSPLKYSFSEARHKKSAVLLDWKEKEDLDYRLIPFVPKRDTRIIRGSLEALLLAGKTAIYEPAVNFDEKDNSAGSDDPRINPEKDDSDNCNRTGKEDYIKAILTDKEDLFDPVGQLREVYPNLMQLEFAKNEPGTIETEGLEEREKMIKEDPFSLFSHFYQMQNDEEMNDAQKELMQNLIERAQENRI